MAPLLVRSHKARRPRFNDTRQPGRGVVVRKGVFDLMGETVQRPNRLRALDVREEVRQGRRGHLGAAKVDPASAAEGTGHSGILS